MNESNYRVHLLYWAIIFAFLALFLILCVPGKINDEAFANFSFASVLVSIVLAVISIVLSISVGQSTSRYNLEIKDVEKEIQEKLKRFDDLEGSIRSSVGSIVKEEVEDVKKRQSEMNKSLEILIGSASRPGTKIKGGTLDLSGVSYLCVSSLYLASLCFKTSKPLPMLQLQHSAGIILGFLTALSTIEPDNILIEVKNEDVYVSKFSSNRWGKETDLKKAVVGIDNAAIKNQVMEASRDLLDE